MHLLILHCLPLDYNRPAILLCSLASSTTNPAYFAIVSNTILSLRLATASVGNCSVSNRKKVVRLLVLTIILATAPKGLHVTHHILCSALLQMKCVRLWIRTARVRLLKSQCAVVPLSNRTLCTSKMKLINTMGQWSILVVSLQRILLERCSAFVVAILLCVVKIKEHLARCIDIFMIWISLSSLAALYWLAMNFV